MQKLSMEQSACFTGHRVFSADSRVLRLRLELALLELAGRGYRYFLSGMAWGFDLLAAETVIDLKKKTDIRLVAVYPCPPEDYACNWRKEDRQRLNQLRESADLSIRLAPNYYTGCMQARNEYLVEHSSFVLACCERDVGGTANTLRMAARKKLPVWNLARAGEPQQIPALLQRPGMI